MIQEEKDPWLIEIKERKLCLQEQVSAEVSFDKCVYPISRNQSADCQQHSTFSLLGSQLRNDTFQMHPQVQAHQDKTPVCQWKMNGAAEIRQAIGRKECI